MQNLRQRLCALSCHSLKEWFDRNPMATQFILMLSKNNAACFVMTKDHNLKLEIAPAYLDCNGIPRRETYRDENGILWESILKFKERETHREYQLGGGFVEIPPQTMEEAFSQAEEAYSKLTSKVFRPSFLYDFVEEAQWEDKQ